MREEQVQSVMDSVESIMQAEGYFVTLTPVWETQQGVRFVDHVKVDLGFREGVVDVLFDGPLWMARDLLKGIEKLL